jgi:hypothetical protein
MGNVQSSGDKQPQAKPPRRPQSQPHGDTKSPTADAQPRRRDNVDSRAHSSRSKRRRNGESSAPISPLQRYRDRESPARAEYEDYNKSASDAHDPVEHSPAQKYAGRLQSEPHAHFNTEILHSNHRGEKDINLEAVFSLLQEVQRTASPDELFALRK